MTRRRPELADVSRSAGPAYEAAYKPSREQRRVLRDITRCRTAVLGGHKKSCDHCGHEEFCYNSCRNRHCPKCQGAATAQWLSDRAAELLDTPYFHLVFTLPHPLGPLALQNKKLLYGLLFRAASESLRVIANDPKHLGADIGFLAVLHTWGQKLDHHPHLHCVVPGGGLSADRTRWISAKKRFFLPVRVLSSLFRGKFLGYLERAFNNGQLEFHGKLAGLNEKSAWNAFLRRLRRQAWVVYCKPPFGSPELVLKYLARYTHRVAISNQRLLSLRDGNVTFRYNDTRTGNRHRTMTLEATEFIRRFLQHVLPPSFHRIRHYGFLANRVRTERIARCRELLETDLEKDSPSCPSPAAEIDDIVRDETCPVCKTGRLRIVEQIPPQMRAPAPRGPALLDSS